jgi:hypothetical protein
MSNFKLSENTTELLKKKQELEAKIRLDTIADAATLLSHTIEAKRVSDLSYLDAAFRLAILEDLAEKYNIEPQHNDKDTSLKGRSKFLLYAIAGTLLNICVGLAGGASMLSLFIGVPGWAILMLGIILALIYVTRFIGVDLATISRNLHIGLYKSKSLLDIFIKQATTLDYLIVRIGEKINELNDTIIDFRSPSLRTTTPTNNLGSPLPFGLNKLSSSDSLINAGPLDTAELKELLSLLKALTGQQDHLAKIREVYNQELKHPYIRTLKLLFPLTTDVLLFNVGFFAGQAIATLIGSTFFALTISASSWPVILFSVFTGIVALSLYWANERLNVENFVGICVGLDLKKIELLPKSTDIRTDGLKHSIKQSRFNLKLFEHSNSSPDAMELDQVNQDTPLLRRINSAPAMEEKQKIESHQHSYPQ